MSMEFRRRYFVLFQCFWYIADLRFFDIYLLGVTRSRTQRLIYLSGIGSILGSLLGTIFIPLDANEVWQQWPITVFAGSVCGYVAGAFVWLLKCGQ